MKFSQISITSAHLPLQAQVCQWLSYPQNLSLNESGKNMELYDQISYRLSKTITRKYSTSFSLGIHMLDKHYHESIYAVYGFVRLADEIVDTFHDYDKEKLFRNFAEDTFHAIDDKISTNPVLNSFQDTVNKYKIDLNLIRAFFISMEMDLSISRYDDSNYEEYIYGSAEVVGLMCLKVFCGKQTKLYEELVSHARSLGSAFQKVNFLRDFKSDFKERGRIYFPGIDFTHFTADQKRRIEADIQKDFDLAWKGIKSLPKGSKLGVMVAYIYYKALFRKISLIPAHRIQNERIRISNITKLALLIKTWLQHKLNLI